MPPTALKHSPIAKGKVYCSFAPAKWSTA
uniref:Uncharacterized protein n=1 Tax=Arundo donax TaxID=35708 RepID=A0A0A9HMU6_ARUDO